MNFKFVEVPPILKKFLFAIMGIIVAGYIFAILTGEFYAMVIQVLTSLAFYYLGFWRGIDYSNEEINAAVESFYEKLKLVNKNIPDQEDQ